MGSLSLHVSVHFLLLLEHIALVDPSHVSSNKVGQVGEGKQSKTLALDFSLSKKLTFLLLIIEI